MNNQAASAGDGQPFTVYHLGPSVSGLTLAAALKDSLGAVSWGQVRRWILARRVEINGNLCLDQARRVGPGDVVKLWSRPLPKPVDTNDIRLVHLDQHLLVVQKPAGITSVRHFEERGLGTRRRQLQPTLEELLPPVIARTLRMRWPPLPPKGQNRGTRHSKQRLVRSGATPVQPAYRLPAELQVIPVHRLDRHTSGLMLFARTRPAEQKLVAMFREHLIQRDYVGVCHGSLAAQTIRSLLIRDRGDGLRGSLPESADDQQREAAQLAVTHVLGCKPLAGGKYSLFRCRLETGRTHQIRIHLAEIGHRLCGEPLYIRDINGQQLTDDSGAPRQALHSDRLALMHPFTGQQLKFEMPWPRDLADWLRGL
ncbi:MAG: RluA family pseudouridine synthase [Pirellulaceae bacterium]|nr:RluA family pseudouridine synthase [Pirellulaceae bacterium]